jgi:hypothetical protein
MATGSTCRSIEELVALSGGSAFEAAALALISLFGWLKYFREKRQRENLSQRELLKQEFIQIVWAIVAIILIMGALAALALWIRR